MANLADIASSGLNNFLTGGIDNFFAKKSDARQWKYRQQEMEKQQQYNRENMQRQFDYSVRAWRMNNEYNDPSASVARWRAAGIAPQAVYGSSPGGAGVAGGIDSPTSSDPSSSYASHGYPGGRMTIAEAAALRNQDRLTEADVDLKAAQAEDARASAEGKRNENSIFSITRRIREANAQSAEADAWCKKVEAAYANINAGIEVDKNRAALDNLLKDIEEKDSRIKVNNEEIDRIKSETRLNDARTENTEAQTKTENATRPELVKGMVADRHLKMSQEQTEWYRQQLFDGQAHLVDSESDVAKARARQIDKEVDYLVSKNLLTEENARYLKAARRRAWAEFGVNTALGVSRELRGWIQSSKDSGVSGFNNVDLDAIAPLMAY